MFSLFAGSQDVRFAWEKFGGAKRDRTADLLHAMQALSQLSYSPILAVSGGWCRSRLAPVAGVYFRLSGLASDKIIPGQFFSLARKMK
jgi:hypothetical protein